jgi:hypothetical protein
LYFLALEQWLKHPNHQEVVRDIGERTSGGEQLSENEYNYDMNAREDDPEEDDDLGDFIVSDDDNSGSDGSEESSSDDSESAVETQDEGPKSPERRRHIPEPRTPITRSQTRRKRERQKEVVSGSGNVLNLYRRFVLAQYI